MFSSIQNMNNQNVVNAFAEFALVILRNMLRIFYIISIIRMENTIANVLINTKHEQPKRSKCFL